jgi:hypothetical protein
LDEREKMKENKCRSGPVAPELSRLDFLKMLIFKLHKITTKILGVDYYQIYQKKNSFVVF